MGSNPTPGASPTKPFTSRNTKDISGRRDMRIGAATALILLAGLALAYTPHAYVLTIISGDKQESIHVLNGTLSLGTARGFASFYVKPGWEIRIIAGNYSLDITVDRDILVVLGEPRGCEVVPLHVLSTIETLLVSICRSPAEAVLNVGGLAIRLEMVGGIGVARFDGFLNQIAVESSNTSIILHRPVTISDYPAILSSDLTVTRYETARVNQSVYTELSRLAKRLAETKSRLEELNRTCLAEIEQLRQQLSALRLELSVARSIGPKAIMQTAAQVAAPALVAYIFARAWLARKRVLRPAQTNQGGVSLLGRLRSRRSPR